ncbi:MAG: hypothetical protein SFV55_28955 [Haliscomenobacter sp.]|uniref:hypothetical protein n=1 Tax=Haliscomenobacter sp. TaxID=2717303 RepID=UPI0029AF3B1C|nr:hypothetical protein [Haliscomenobacter sp.]MDX2072498.1 hypothetical protein [Haliscomenobacter sp.]
MPGALLKAQELGHLSALKPKLEQLVKLGLRFNLRLHFIKIYFSIIYTNSPLHFKKNPPISNPISHPPRNYSRTFETTTNTTMKPSSLSTSFVFVFKRTGYYKAIEGS